MEPWFLEQGGIYPSTQLSNHEINGIKKFMSDWLKKIGLNNACISFEAKCRPESMYHVKNFDTDLKLINDEFFMPIESNLRMVGAGGWSSIKASFDVDLITLVFKVCLGIQIDDADVADEPHSHAISKDITPNVNAEIESLKININKLSSMDNLMEIVINRAPGDKITVQNCIGWITLKDHLEKSDAQLNMQIDEVLKCIEIKFKE